MSKMADVLMHVWEADFTFNPTLSMDFFSYLFQLFSRYYFILYIIFKYFNSLYF